MIGSIDFYCSPMQGWRVGRHRDSKILLAQNNCFPFLYFSLVICSYIARLRYTMDTEAEQCLIDYVAEIIISCFILFLTYYALSSEEVKTFSPSLALSLLSGFICSRKQKPAGSIGGKMPKTVVTLRRILTVIIPFIYIFFVQNIYRDF